MSFRLDSRVPLIFAAREQAGPDDALLLESPGAAPAGVAVACFSCAAPVHAPGCACCAPRGAAGRALAALLQARARGTVPFFRRVVAVPATAAGRAAIDAALASDPVAAACFRLAD